MMNPSLFSEKLLELRTLIEKLYGPDFAKDEISVLEKYAEELLAREKELDRKKVK